MRFKLFNTNKDGKGVDKNENTTPNILFYFKSLWRKFSRLISINLFMLIQIIPIVVVVLSIFWGEKSPTFSDPNFPIYYGISHFDNSPSFNIALLLSSIQLMVPVLSLKDILWIGAWLLIFAVTFGWFNVAFTYLMREMVRGNAVFLFSDIKYAIKKNFKQGFLVGLIDFLLLVVLLFNIISMTLSGTTPFTSFMYLANLGILTLYIVMRYYIYLMLITFDIKFTKMLKNAMIFTVLGIKRNVMAILWILVLLLLNFLIFLLYMPLGIALPILYFFAVTHFTAVYAAYPVIDKYMIKPYQTQEENDFPDNDIDGEDVVPENE